VTGDRRQPTVREQILYKLAEIREEAAARRGELADLQRFVDGLEADAAALVRVGELLGLDTDTGDVEANGGPEGARAPG